LVLGGLSHLLNFAGGALAERIPPLAHGASCEPRRTIALLKPEKRSGHYRQQQASGASQ